MEGLPLGGVASRGLHAPAGGLHVPSPLPHQQAPASTWSSVWGLGVLPITGTAETALWTVLASL